LGSYERTGYALALYTGQRRADLIELKWASIAGNAFRLKQKKTGAELTIPIHPLLEEALAAVHPRHEAAIIAGPTGKNHCPVYFGHKMAAAISEAGLPEACVLHGLRKTACKTLIEAGCTLHEAAAITGQKSLRMLEHYSKAANQKTLANEAMNKWAEQNVKVSNLKIKSV
jgi:integrase